MRGDKVSPAGVYMLEKIRKIERMNIYINEDGNILGLYSDVYVLLKELGVIKVHRASNIEFNEKQQKWEVDVPNEGIIASFDKRSDALEWEVQYLESKIELNAKEDIND